MNDGLFHADNTRGVSQWFVDVCPVCGKHFEHTAMHAYYVKQGYKQRYVCTWRCLRAWQDVHRETSRDRRSKASKQMWAKRKGKGG